MRKKITKIKKSLRTPNEIIYIILNKKISTKANILISCKNLLIVGIIFTLTLTLI